MIIVAGEALIDLILRPDGHVVAVPGGGPFNTACAIGRLGGQVEFLGRLSTDRFGLRLREGLVSDGVALTHAVTTDAPTTLAVAELDEAGAATYRFHTAETSAPGLELDAVLTAIRSGPAAVHIGTLGLVLEPMAGALADGVRRLAADVLLMVDPNCRPPVIGDRPAYLDRLDGLLERADVVKVSSEDLAFTAPGRSATEVARTMVARGVAVVLLTDGSRPVSVVGRSFETELPVPHLTVVDTVGCGDAFGGAFLARWIEQGLGRRDLADEAIVTEAVTRAIEVASLTSQRSGANPPTRLEAGWQTR